MTAASQNERPPDGGLADPQRLAALRAAELLDTPPEEAFDRLTRLAARLLHTPTALLSLVDGQRQFFKSSIGLPEPWASERGTPLSHSICKRVVAAGSPLAIGDVRGDPDCAAIAELGVVAYLGMPLKTSDGQTLGSFCVIDRVPREWKEDERASVAELAELAMSEIEERILARALIRTHEDRIAEVAHHRDTLLAEVIERRQIEQALRESEAHFRVVIERVHDHAIIIVGKNRQILTWNPGAESLFGWQEEEILGRPFELLFTADDQNAGVPVRELDEAARLGRGEDERWHMRKDGSVFFASGGVEALRDERGEIRSFVKIARDITAHRNAEDALRASEERLRMASDAAGVGHWDWNIVTGELVWDERCKRIFGIPAEELMSYERFISTIHPEDREKADHSVRRSIDTLGGYHITFRTVRPGGEFRWVLAKGRTYGSSDGQPQRMCGVAMDITARKQAEEQIKASLAEKETLLREIHHRVKNNLQIIASLLNLQTRHIADSVARGLFNDALERVRAIALIHEMLYRSDDLSHVDLLAYAAEMLGWLLPSGAVASRRITRRVEGESVILGIDHAISCGLILNELATNSLKHAFPDGRGGEVVVTLRRDPAKGEVVIQYRDNGVGLPAGFDPAASRSLGMSLIGDLVRKLKGSLCQQPIPGYGVIIRFQETPAAPDAWSSGMRQVSDLPI